VDSTFSSYIPINGIMVSYIEQKNRCQIGNAQFWGKRNVFKKQKTKTETRLRPKDFENKLTI